MGKNGCSEDPRDIASWDGTFIIRRGSGGGPLGGTKFAPFSLVPPAGTPIRRPRSHGKTGQPRGDSLHRPGGDGVGGHPGTVPPSRQVPTEFACFAVGSLSSRKMAHETRRPNITNSCDIPSR